MYLIGDCLQCRDLKKAIYEIGSLDIDNEFVRENIEEVLEQADQHMRDSHMAPRQSRSRDLPKADRGDLERELERLHVEYEEFNLRHLLAEQELG